MGKTYKLIKLVKGYILVDPKVDTKLDTSEEITIKDLHDNNVKVIASSEKLSPKYKTLNINNCNDCFGLKSTIQPKVTKKYKDAPNGSFDQLKGVSEMMRLETYNYLSGRLSHEAFIKIYGKYEEFLGDQGIVKVNGMVGTHEDGNWRSDDENNDDEYFNDYLEAKHLNRELSDMRTSILVDVVQMRDESGYVVMFPIIDDE